MRCNEQAFENGIGIPPEQETILECAWLSFGCITNDITKRARMIEYCFPFHACRKPCPTPSSQSGLPDIVDNFQGTEGPRFKDGAGAVLCKVRLVLRVRYIRQKIIVHAPTISLKQTGKAGALALLALLPKREFVTH